MRLLLRFVFPAALWGVSLIAVGAPPPAGTWKLSSERIETPHRFRRVLS